MRRWLRRRFTADGRAIQRQLDRATAARVRLEQSAAFWAIVARAFDRVRRQVAA
jgi:hypothetical protein